MRELWCWEIEQGREFTAHCRQIAEKTEIRILNIKKNCVSSYKTKTSTESGNEHAKCLYDSTFKICVVVVLQDTISGP